MFRTKFTNKEWNSLNWVTTGFKIGEDGMHACEIVAKKLGYEKLGLLDDYIHDIYIKNGKLYFIENRNTGVEIALADFKGNYIERIYKNKRNNVVYSEQAKKTLMLEFGFKGEDFELIKEVKY